MNRLNKYAVNSYYVDLIKRKGNLRDTLISARVVSSRETITELFSDPNAWNALIKDSEKSEKIEEIINNIDKKSVEQVDEFFVILLNQTLVMLCTVFDTYLVDCFDVITRARPDLLKSFTSDKDLLINEFLDGKDYDDVFNIIQSKVIKRFDFGGIEDKLKYFEKAGITKEDLFTLNDIMSPKHPTPLDEIMKAYGDRHDIVHRNQMKILEYKEIANISDLMTHLIMRWGGIDFRKKFGIDSDLNLISQGKILPPNE